MLAAAAWILVRALLVILALRRLIVEYRSLRAGHGAYTRLIFPGLLLISAVLVANQLVSKRC
jgi:hypothetical protein